MLKKALIVVCECVLAVAAGWGIVAAGRDAVMFLFGSPLDAFQNIGAPFWLAGLAAIARRLIGGAWFEQSLLLTGLRRVFAWGNRKEAAPFLLLAGIAPIALLVGLRAISLERGLTGAYYAKPEFSGSPVLTALDRTIDLRRIARIQPSMTRNYGIAWGGVLWIAEPGVYHFMLGADDGAVLSLNSEMLVDNSGAHGYRERSQWVRLDAGFHALDIRYAQYLGAAHLRVLWQQPGQAWETLAAAHLFPRVPTAMRWRIERVVMFLAAAIPMWLGMWGLFVAALVLKIAGHALRQSQAVPRWGIWLWQQRANVGMLVVSTLFSVFIAEIALRQVRPNLKYPFHGVSSRQFHHLYPADKEMYAGEYEGEQVTVRTNEDGLRSRYSRRKFLAHQERIAILGDSFTFGFGVRQEQTFQRVVENRLRRHLRRNDVAVLNAGVIGSSPLLEELVFDGIVAAYQPTLVLLCVDASDIGNDVQYAREAIVRNGRVSFEVPPARMPRYYGALHELLRPSHFQPRYDYYRFEVNIGGVIEDNFYFIFRPPLEKTLPYFEATMSHINSLARKVEASGAKFLLVVLPRFQHWNPNESPENWEGSKYRVPEPHQDEYLRFFETQRPQVEYAVLNLLPAFQQTDRFPLVFKNDPHWNAQGHAFVGETVADYLLQQHVID